MKIPGPRSLEDLKKNPDYVGGEWVFVELDIGGEITLLSDFS